MQFALTVLPHRAPRALGVAVLAALAACGGDNGGGTVAPPTVTPTIELSAPASVAVGGTLSLSAKVSTGASVTWSSNTPSVVTVSASGAMTGIAPGAGEVKASIGSVSATASVTVLAPFVDLSLGGRHACGRTAQNVLYCWGDNGVAALGKATPEICPSQSRSCSTLPLVTVESPSFVRVSGGFGGVTCGLTTAGAAYCWGNNSDDWIPRTADTCTVVGVGTSACVRTPVPVPGGIVFTTIALGGNSACGLTAGGAAYCWGGNADGQLGAATAELCGEAACSRTPTAVSGGRVFTSLAVGNAHACGIATGGAAYCWGTNAAGQLGNVTGGGVTPTLVSGGRTFVMLSAFSTQTCGVDTSGDAYCWGGNATGQLGNNTTTSSTMPQLVSGGLKFLSVAASLEHTCGLATNGDAYCWGQNTGLQVSGQLGNGTSTPSPVPVKVIGGRSFVQLLAGRQFTCGRTATGTVYCWGDNRFGQLGAGNLTLLNSSSPLGVAGAP